MIINEEPPTKVMSNVNISQNTEYAYYSNMQNTFIIKILVSGNILLLEYGGD